MLRSSSSVFTADCLWQSIFRRLRRAVIQRRSSLKAQGAAKKDAEKCCRAHFFLGPVRAYRNPLPAAKKVRAIEIAIAILPHKMCSSHSCFVQSSPQRLIKQHIHPAKKSAGHPGCFQYAIDYWHKPPKRAQKRQFWPIKKKRGTAFLRHCGWV